MKRKIVVCGIFMTTVFMLGWPANKSFANNGYTSGNGPIENHMVSMKILQGKDGNGRPIVIDSDDFKVVAQRLDMLYEQLPDQYKESFKTNMGF